MRPKLLRPKQEYIFLGILIVLLFFLIAYDKEEEGLLIHKTAFLISYILGAIFINYFLLPRFLYRKKVWAFTSLIILVFVLLVLIEELVLEQLFFTDTRARGFSMIRTLGDVFPPIVLLVGYKFSWDAMQKQNRIDALNRLVAESELQFLNSQINPHFLFNNLNTLYSYALNKSPKTPEIILQLSSIMRYMLYDCRDKTVLLEKEVENLEDFVQLSRLQLENQGNISFKVEGHAGQLRISPLILMVFVENAFKHASSSRLDEIQINISLSISNNYLTFLCENNYSAKSNTENLPRGIGLKNASGRLDLAYPDKYNLNIDDSNNWYRVELEMELE